MLRAQHRMGPTRSMLDRLRRDLEAAIEARSNEIPRPLRQALKLALHSTFREVVACGEPEALIEAFVDELAFELGLHADASTGESLASELAALVSARLALPAAAA